MKVQHLDIEYALKTVGLRVTEPRQAVLRTLWRNQFPVSAAHVANALTSDVDPVTVYRTLDTLTEVGLVQRTDFRHGHAEYELAINRPHHHHVVCTDCSAVEDVMMCPAPHFERRALSVTKKFAHIDTHTFELFGQCKKCATT